MMAPNTEPFVDTRSPEEVERDIRALDFILNDDPNVVSYTETRTVFGRFSMTFRVLNASELLQADVVANNIQTEAIGARAIEREIMWIVQSLQGVGKKGEKPKPLTKNTIEEKHHWVEQWPYSLLSAAVKEYQAVEANFRKMCDPESIKNLQGEPDTSIA